MKDHKPFIHIPVLGQELITGLDLVPDGLYLDATLGAGGHSHLIFTNIPKAKVMGIDQDGQAIAQAQANLAEYKDRLEIWQGNFADYQPNHLQFDGIIADLGVNSGQLDTADRGFSFRQAAPLDMRMNQQQQLTAAEIINTWTEKALADIFYTYGEERWSRRLAQKIVNQRPFYTTTALAETIAANVPSKYRYGRIHPATRIFQAIRIVVNSELTSLEKFLGQAPLWLKPSGKIGIISFHSLEDRLVKHSFRNSSLLRVLTKKPIVPQPQEIEINPRARSAKLRWATKI